MKSWFFGLFLVGLLTASTLGYAQPAEVLWQMPASARGLAGAGRAAAANTSAMMQNPAGLGFTVQYVLEGIYSHDVKSGMNGFGANWTDSYINPYLAAGLGYTYLSGGDDMTNSAHGINGGIAVPLSRKKSSTILVGMGMHYFNESNGLTMLNDDGSTSTADRDLLTGDFGAMIGIGESLRIGVVGYNLISSMDSEHKPALGSGIAFYFSRFGFVMDILAQFKTRGEDSDDPEEEVTGLTYQGGLIIAATRNLVFRAGGAFDSLNHRGQAAGCISFMIPEGFGFEIAYNADLQDMERSVITVGLQMYPLAFVGKPN